MTKQRQLVLKIINSFLGHLTAEEVFSIAKSSIPTISRATIYNNLNYLTSNGFIRRIKVHDSPDLYDKIIPFHDHLYYDSCGEITNVTVDNLLGELKEKTGYDIISYDLTLHYICPKCNKKHK